MTSYFRAKSAVLFPAINILNLGVPLQHTLPATPVGSAILMNDIAAKSSGAIALPEVNTSRQEPEVTNFVTERTYQTMPVLKPVHENHSTIGKAYQIPEATIAVIESLKVHGGFQQEGNREGLFFTPWVTTSCQFFCQTSTNRRKTKYIIPCAKCS